MKPCKDAFCLGTNLESHRSHGYIHTNDFLYNLPICKYFVLIALQLSHLSHDASRVQFK